MASPDDEIEPAAVCSAVPYLNKRRFSSDRCDLKLVELDSLLKNTEGRPFTIIHRLTEIKEMDLPYLMPGTPITCNVNNTEKHTSRSKVRVRNLYTVKLTHGPFHWVVKRKYKHFQELHRDLYKHKMMLHFMPTRRSVSRLTCKSASYSGGRKYLEEYLNDLLENGFCRNDRSMIEFLSVGALSFVTDLGPKGLEGPIIKRSGGHRVLGLNCIGHHRVCFRWSHRWLVVKDSFLLYMSRDNNEINFVLLFDPEFEVKVDRAETGTEYGVCIKNFTRDLIIKCRSYRQSQWWTHEIKQLAHSCDFLKVHRFQGFAPPREDTLTKWYVNGKDYFADLADALEQAKQEIFITDWWLSPEIFLKRPATDNHWRLDEILKRKAGEGVKVCVLLYKEVEMALGINSDYSKRTLMNMHPNIKVMRHPDHVASAVVLWAHHEKMVAIDQTVAFVGGLDLAFGRWDDREYRLADLGQAEVLNGGTGEHPNKDATDNGVADGHNAHNQTKQDPTNLAGNTKLWLGKDYSNFIKKDWTLLDRPFEDNIDRTKVPRMPWRDLATAMHGKAARDVARHFIQRWNFTKIFKVKYKDNFYPYLLPKSHTGADLLPFIVPGSQKAKVQVLRSSEQQKKYRVFVVIPLLPGFEGDITTGGGNAIQAIMHFTYRTMCRGDHSILSRLSEVKDQWTEYITFCGLRTHSQLAEKLVTELIYVHSKALVADDRRYIIGSANINDRSMLGSRDSELAVLVEDQERVPSVMGGQEYEAGPLALALRKECFRVLTGATSDPSINIDDPISDYFFFLTWNETAKRNAIIYDKVFRCLPCNSVHNLLLLKNYSSQERLCDTDPEQAAEELKAIRGLLVHFPLKFLCEENLQPPLNSKEGIAPTDLWT
ncbi:hypothetical protein CCH79_00002010, partial [Gambusia affinis]